MIKYKPNKKWEYTAIDENGKLLFKINSSEFRRYYENGKLVYSIDMTTGYWKRWSYNVNGQKVLYENAYGSHRIWEYDSEGRVIKIQQKNKIQEWEYDSEGKVIMIRKGNEIRRRNSEGKLV